MNKLESLLLDLKRINENRNENYSKDFEDILAKITDLKNVSSINLLVNYFEDNAEYDELMFSIIHSIESFNDDEYVEEIIKVLPVFYSRSPKWATIVHIRILNSEPTLKAYTKAISQTNYLQKDAIRNIILRINNRNSKFLDKTAQILNAL